jgi:hypothetical protein
MRSSIRMPRRDRPNFAHGVPHAMASHRLSCGLRAQGGARACSSATNRPWRRRRPCPGPLSCHLRKSTRLMTTTQSFPSAARMHTRARTHAHARTHARARARVHTRARACTRAHARTQAHRHAHTCVRLRPMERTGGTHPSPRVDGRRPDARHRQVSHHASQALSSSASAPPPRGVVHIGAGTGASRQY